MRLRSAKASVTVERHRTALIRDLIPLHQATQGRWFARLYYIEHDDSFILKWELPSGIQTSPVWTGLNAYINPDDCMSSYRFLVKELAKLNLAKSVPNDLSLAEEAPTHG